MFRQITTAVVACALLVGGGLGMAHAQERPSKDKMDAARNCFGKAGLDSPPGPDKSVQLTAEQRKSVDKCLKEAGIDIPNGKR